MIITLLSLLALANPLPPPHARLTATGGYDDGPVRVVHVVSDLDTDKDGIKDQYDLRVTCSGTPSAIIAPRDAASGLATGKRMHKPMTITKELDRHPGGGLEDADDWEKAVAGRVVAEWDVVPLKGGATARAVKYDLAVCKKA